MTEFTLGTLASLTAMLGGTKVDAARKQGCDIKKIRYAVSMFGKTAGANEGPIVYGLAYDVTIAEIAAFYASDPQGQDDELELVRSMLPIIEYGRYGQVTQSDDITPEAPMTKLQPGYWGGWPIREGSTLNTYVFNANPNDALTTGALLQFTTEIFGEWRQD